jgi:cholest-4-en-3-one 26-monooxygenase
VTDVDPLDLVDPDRFAARGYPHDVWTRLRAEQPVARIEAPEHKPFWAITKHADIVQISKQPLLFSNVQGVTLPKENDPPLRSSEMVVLLDPPKHAKMRRVAMGRFTPGAVRARRTDIERIALDVLDGALEPGGSGEIDFVQQVAAPFPLAVMAWSLGVPREDWHLLYRWTNEIIGKDDPEFRPAGESPGKTFRRARGELHSYFEQLLEKRRGEPPRDDVVSVLLAHDIDGAPLTSRQLLEYCEVLVEAGNETTRNAISGAALVFSEQPGKWEQLRACPELLPETVEEVLRWVSPITHFARVATEDCELRGQRIRAGDPVALYFASANRDEDVFDEPFAFRIDRSPNPHLAFGFGEHFCMGANLARVELEVMLRLLLARLDFFELSGRVERLRSTINGSIKHLPIRYRSA